MEDFMCGRYYIDCETVREAGRTLCINREETVQKDQSKEQQENLNNNQNTQKTEWQQDRAVSDIRPGDTIDLILGREGKLLFEKAIWGFPEKTLMINARSETVCERVTFRDSIYQSRAAIPAAGFYEWNQEKEKNMFFRDDKKILFLAGCTKVYSDKLYFVILTVPANESVSPVHTRMPLILEPNEIKDWVLNGQSFEKILKKTPGLLKRQTDYEQISLF